MRRRGLLGALAAPAFLRHALAADVPRFGLGVASGQPQADSVVLWTRLIAADMAPEVSVFWEVAEDESFTRIAARGQDTANVADAHSVHALAQGLRPDRWYWYRFSALGQRSMAGRTRTAPAPGSRVSALHFAIASCQRYDVGHYAAWRHAAEEGLDLVLFLGDYIYEYPSPPTALRPHVPTLTGGPVTLLADYRQRYAQYKSDPALQAAHAAAPWLVIWDDHEVDNDYAGLQGQRLQPDFASQRAAAYQAWWEHMPLPRSARPVDGGMRVHGRLDWGDLARIHLLDTRQQRDPQACPRPGRGGSNTLRVADCPTLADPRRSLLGAEQERWLADGWSLQQAWNLLAQQTLMSRVDWHDSSGSGMFWIDGWDGYPAARKRLLDTVSQRQVPGVVVLGGDVHANYVADLKADPGDHKSATVASEFCGTSISSLGLPQERLDAARGLNPQLHHARSDQRGYVRFALRRDTLDAALRVVADARDPASGITTAARFVVDAKRPGPQPG